MRRMHHAVRPHRGHRAWRVARAMERVGDLSSEHVHTAVPQARTLAPARRSPGRPRIRPRSVHRRRSRSADRSGVQATPVVRPGPHRGLLRRCGLLRPMRRPLLLRALERLILRARHLPPRSRQKPGPALETRLLIQPGRTGLANRPSSLSTEHLDAN
jgi:hypothetical protein